MTADLARALEERGIRLRKYQPGEHRCPCPECGHGPRDDALAVALSERGRALVESRYDWPVVARPLVELHAELGRSR